ncbi:MAG: WD40/YVTN/BNR-like repeat-containing protein [Micromonosporaceae bacterium]
MFTPTRARLQPWSRSATVGLFAFILIIAGGIPAYAGQATDINPDVSNNSDADATTGGRVNGIGVVAGDPDTAYIASEWGGLFLTRDAGATWSHLDTHLPHATWDVKVDPGNTGNVYASSFYDGRTTSVAGIQVSHDGGATWAHPASANPGTGTPCTTTTRTEPSAFGISIRPDQPATVYIGTNCGLARSTDSGDTWTFLDPTGSGNAGQVWDVLAQAGGSLDVCGTQGFFHSPDGGATWVQAATAPGSGLCTLAASPDEPYVVFATSGVSIWETDDAANAAGATWTQLGSPESRTQGRIPLVATNQRADNGGNDVFDLWFGDVRLFRGACTTPATPAPGGALRCPAGRIPPIAGNPGPPAGWAGPFTRSAGAHDDMGDIAFDPTATVDACPTLFSSDGGMHVNTDTGSDCHNPNWSRANVGMHAEWLWGMSGSDAAGATNENLAYGMQDAGGVFTTNAGADPPTWNEPNCCDVFDVLQDDERAVWTVCCNNG